MHLVALVRHTLLSMEIAMSNEEDALLGLVRVLKPLPSEERVRAVRAAMMYLGESIDFQPERRDAATPPRTGDRVVSSEINADYPKGVASWMKQNDLSPDEVDQMLQFKDDGSFDIHGVPGKTKKDQTLNTYIMTGVATFLVSGSREFDDDTARKFCQDIGCLDKPNHASILKDAGPEFSGDKSKGYTLSNVGVKKGAALVKEYAGDGKK